MTKPKVAVYPKRPASLDKTEAGDALFKTMALEIKNAGTEYVIPCRVDPESWFPLGTVDTDHNQRLAAELCGPCPVITQCHEWATAAPRETWGIWGARWLGSRHAKGAA